MEGARANVVFGSRHPSPDRRGSSPFASSAAVAGGGDGGSAAGGGAKG